MSDHTLHIGTAGDQHFRLPASIVTMTTAILGIRGSGKTNTAVAAVEEILDLGYQVIIIDPVDVWWGLKSSKGGEKEGYPIVILGGPHGDLPLTHENGRALADFAVEERIPMILSLRHLRKNKQRSFVMEFAEQLYHRKGEPEYRTPTLVVVDEASTFIPQRVGKAEARLVGAMEDFVRKGRSSGLGMMAIDQRAASVNKDILTQLEILVAHRHTSPQDRAALKEWVKQHDTEGMEKQFLGALASLELGQAYFWSPLLDLFEDVRVRERRTYDSSKTPELGDELPLPDRIARVDLGALENQLAEAIEEAKASDPRELKKRIAELEKQIKEPTDQHPTVDVEKEVETAVAKATDSLNVHISELERQVRFARQRLERARDDILEAVATLDPEDAAGAAETPVEMPTVNGQADRTAAPKPPAPAKLKKSVPDDREAKLKRTAPTVDLEPYDAKILGALSMFESIGVEHVDRTTLAVFAGVGPKSSQYGKRLSTMQDEGLLLYPTSGHVALTDAGRSVAPPGPSIRSVDDLHAAWARYLSESMWGILGFLIEIYPSKTTRENLADAIGRGEKSSQFGKELATLNELGAIDYPQPGYVRASKLLFPDLA